MHARPSPSPCWDCYPLCEILMEYWLPGNEFSAPPFVYFSQITKDNVTLRSTRGEWSFVLTGRFSDVGVMWTRDPTPWWRVKDLHGSRPPVWGLTSRLKYCFSPSMVLMILPLTFCTSSASRLQHRLCSRACFLLCPHHSLSHFHQLVVPKSSPQRQYHLPWEAWLDLSRGNWCQRIPLSG